MSPRKYQIQSPLGLDYIARRIEETPQETEILDAYLIDTDENRSELLKILKKECCESHRLTLVEKFLYDNCPWVDLDHMEAMWDYLGVNKYDCRNGRRVFFEVIPYASIFDYHREKDIICNQIRRNKKFVMSL